MPDYLVLEAVQNGHEGAVHVIAYVVSGIGFLGAGVVVREGGSSGRLSASSTDSL